MDTEALAQPPEEDEDIVDSWRYWLRGALAPAARLKLSRTVRSAKTSPLAGTKATPSSPTGLRVAGDLDPVDDDLAGMRRGESEDGPQRRGLAAAVVADEEHHLAGCDSHRHVAHDLAVAVADAHVGE